MTNFEANVNGFDTMDLGSAKPTSVPMEEVKVSIGVNDILKDFGKAFVAEAFRKNPLRAEQVGLTSDEVLKYVAFLLAERIKSVQGDCPEWRKLKALYVPAYVQYAMRMVGTLTIREYGLKIVPVFEGDVITLEEAYAISAKIGMFEDDLQIVRDAFPREAEGNKDVMSTALVAGYVRALRPVEHVSATYVTAFLGIKLKQEVAFQALYRVQYDDVDFITMALTTQKDLY